MGWHEEWVEAQAFARAEIAAQRTPGEGPAAAPDLSVPVDQLLASAAACESAHEDLRPVLDRAIGDLAAATESLRQWTLGEQLGQSGAGWGAALSDMADRLPEHATGLRAVTSAMVGLDQQLRATFRGWGTV